MVFPIQTSKDSWPTVLRPIGMLFYGSKNENELMVDKMNLFFSLKLIHGQTHKTKDQVKVARKT
jgi:hypothetical protein